MKVDAYEKITCDLIATGDTAIITCEKRTKGVHA